MDKNVVPEISVLLPVYNSEKYILEAVNSILNQTFTNFELIIIDDGSRDSSIQIINSIKDERIVFLRNEENKGLIYTLNKGIGLSKGNYIARMDADDIMEVDRLKTQLEFFKQNSNIIACGSWYTVFGSDYKNNNVRKLLNSPEHLRALSFFKCPLAHPTVMFKKSVINDFQLTYNSAYPYSEDYHLWTEMLNHGDIINIPKPLIKYRFHQNQISKLKHEEKLNTVFEIQKNIFKKLNIDLTKEQFDLNFKIANANYVNDKDLMMQCAAWLNTILEKNATVLYIKNKALEEVVYMLWFNFIANAKVKNRAQYLKLVNTNQDKLITFSDKLKFKVKGLINATKGI